MMTANEMPVQAKTTLFQQLETHLLTDPAPSRFLTTLSETPDFNAYPFSMLKKLKDTPQSPVHHPEGSVWNHTLLVVDEAAKHKEESRGIRAFMWAALLHDIGKPPTTRVRNGGEKITAYNHDNVGAKLTQAFLSEWTDDEAFLDKVTQLVRYHMQLLYVNKRLPFMDIAGMKKHTDIREVALLGLCDRLGRKGADPEDEKRQVAQFIRACTADDGGNKTRKGETMAKAGMRRPDPEAPHGESHERNVFSKNQEKPVPELQGKAKFTKKNADPILYENRDGSFRSV